MTSLSLHSEKLPVSTSHSLPGSSLSLHSDKLKALQLEYPTRRLEADKPHRPGAGASRFDFNAARNAPSVSRNIAEGGPPIRSYTSGIAATYSTYLGLHTGLSKDSYSGFASQRPPPLSVTGTTLAESLVTAQAPHTSSLDRVRSVLHTVSQAGGLQKEQQHGVRYFSGHDSEELHGSHAALPLSHHGVVHPPPHPANLGHAAAAAKTAAAHAAAAHPHVAAAAAHAAAAHPQDLHAAAAAAHHAAATASPHDPHAAHAAATHALNQHVAATSVGHPAAHPVDTHAALATAHAATVNPHAAAAAAHAAAAHPHVAAAAAHAAAAHPHDAHAAAAAAHHAAATASPHDPHAAHAAATHALNQHVAMQAEAAHIAHSMAVQQDAAHHAAMMSSHPFPHPAHGY
eukprot:TRINITY_DN4977_c0_g1_i4.p1 TRINITY_DN4977_c0_g1~~TRINITY_DN4977_c0_g1_i4.p1  ORF type:complete len:426 (+),score=94.57 TRINITY_DN4977_c0_g1_i4:76-1278(+)